MASTTEEEYLRVTQMISGLTISVPLMQMTIERVRRIENAATTDSTMDALNNELRRRLVAVKRPEDHTQLGQVYEAFAEAVTEAGEADLRKRLLERHSIEVGGGLGELAGQVWRVGLMGENARPESVDALVKALQTERGQRLLIVIAHRLSTIRSADRIVFIDRGKILETGSHDELMARRGGAYRRFVDLQIGATA